MTPDEWLANFEAKVADVQQKAAAFKHNLESSGATETSPDGALRVTVAPNGALTGLTIHDAAMRVSGAELAAQIMNLARQAQRAAAGKVAAAFAPISGMDPEPPRPAPAAPEIPPARPARPRAGRRADEEDFSEEQIFGRDDDA